MLETIDTVERERERARFSEIGFICCDQNTVLAVIRKINFNRIRIEKRIDYLTT